MNLWELWSMPIKAFLMLQNQMLVNIYGFWHETQEDLLELNLKLQRLKDE